MKIISVGKLFIEINYLHLYYLFIICIYLYYLPLMHINLKDFHTNVGWLFMNILKTYSQSNGRHTFLKTTPSKKSQVVKWLTNTIFYPVSILQWLMASWWFDQSLIVAYKYTVTRSRGIRRQVESCVLIDWNVKVIKFIAAREKFVQNHQLWKQRLRK